METGLMVQVPAFVNEGDRIRIDTANGAYIERVK
jgi:elongation factor P